MKVQVNSNTRFQRRGDRTDPGEKRDELDLVLSHKVRILKFVEISNFWRKANLLKIIKNKNVNKIENRISPKIEIIMKIEFLTNFRNLNF